MRRTSGLAKQIRITPVGCFVEKFQGLQGGIMEVDMRRKQDMCRNWRRRRWAVWWLAGALAVSLWGCGSPAGGFRGEEGAASGEPEGEKSSVAMGRYAESMSEVDGGQLMDLAELSDGRLALLENGAVGRMLSSDGGVTWQEEMLPGWEELAVNCYVQDMKVSCDGSVAILCRSYQKTEAAEEEEPLFETGIYLILPGGGRQRRYECL